MIGWAMRPFLLTFVILSATWLLFSGRFDLFHLGLGAVSCAGVSAVTAPLLFPKGWPCGLMGCWMRFAAYLPWLFYQIFLANLHLLRLTFHPRMPELINPRIVWFNSTLASDTARTTLANSITLTPGTITVHAGVMGEFAVHCIDDASAKDLPGSMETRIQEVFPDHE